MIVWVWHQDKDRNSSWFRSLAVSNYSSYFESILGNEARASQTGVQSQNSEPECSFVPCTVFSLLRWSIQCPWSVCLLRAKNSLSRGITTGLHHPASHSGVLSAHGLTLERLWGGWRDPLDRKRNASLYGFKLAIPVKNSMAVLIENTGRVIRKHWEVTDNFSNTLKTITINKYQKYTKTFHFSVYKH